MIEISYRPATEADLPKLTDIYNEVIAEGGFTADLSPYSLAERRSWFMAHQQEPFSIYVLEDNRQIFGYFCFSPWRSGRAAMREVAEISYYLSKSARGKGLGHYLLQEAQQIAIKAGLKYLLAILLESNSGSRALLEKNAFDIVGQLPHIANLGDRRCGQLIMYKDLQKGLK